MLGRFANTAEEVERTGKNAWPNHLGSSEEKKKIFFFSNSLENRTRCGLSIANGQLLYDGSRWTREKRSYAGSTNHASNCTRSAMAAMQTMMAVEKRKEVCT